VRVYLPATLPLLEQWLAAGEAELAVGTSVFAVTPALRESYREADLDELEHAAQVDASVGSLRLLADDPAAPRRRVVVAAEIADDLVTPDSSRGRAKVLLDGPVAISRWASALVDEADSAAVVADAIAALAAAAGDGWVDPAVADAQFALDEAEAHELGWYAVQELRYLFT
jgi:hypothetical protein